MSKGMSDYMSLSLVTPYSQDDELKLGNLEDQLRSTVQGLKEELQKEMKTKMSYQGKIEADETDLEKMKVEHKIKEENVNETAREIEVKKNSHHEAMDRLLEAHKEKLDQEGMLIYLTGLQIYNAVKPR